MTTIPENPLFLAATDHSEASRLAVDLAAQLAFALGGRVGLVHATDVPHADPNLPGAMADFERAMLAALEAREARARMELERAAARVAAHHVAVDTALLDGRAWRAIVAAVEAAAPHAVVVGRHGAGAAGGLARWLLGSTADRVLRASSAPVLLGPVDADALVRLRGGRIVVAADLESSSRRALALALRWAQRLDASVEIVHVVEAPRLLEPEPAELAAQLTAAARASLEALVASVRGAADPAPELTIARGDTVTQVSARAAAAALLVVGTHGRSGVAAVVLGSVAERIVRTVPGPVLVVRA